MQFSVEPVFGWYGVVPLTIIMLASLWLTLSNTSVSMGGRIVLLLLRLLAAVVLLLGWLRPGLISSRERESAGAIAVVMDISESMTLPSESSDRSRWQVEQEVWQKIVADTNLKIGQTQLVPYFFDRRLHVVPREELPNLKRQFEKPPKGNLTDLGQALSEVSRQQLEPPLRGVILMTDAAQTVVPPEVDPNLIARQMAQLDQPILIIGIGPRADQSQLRDVAIEGMPEHLEAFSKKELQIPLLLRAQGVQNQPIQLKLKLRASGKPDILVGTKDLKSEQPSQLLSPSIEIVAPEPGEYLLEAEATIDANEQVKSNNLAIAFVTVREGGARILYLEGEPRTEQKFLKWSLNASRDFVVNFSWIPERLRSRWPIDFAKPPMNVDFSKYDAFIFGDIDSSAISPENLGAIRKRVAAGAGLLLLGGYHSFDAGGFAQTPLAPLYPTQLQPGRQAFNAPIEDRYQGTRPTRMKLTTPHPITSLHIDPTKNQEIWQNLKPLLSINRLGRPKNEPGVQVLAVSELNEPILVTGEYGNGRVLAFAGDTTYQWWLGGQQQIHKQFWRQSLLWLLRRDTISEGFLIKMDRRRLVIDDSTKVNIEWFGGSENRSMPERLKLEMTREGQWLRNLETQVEGDSRRQAAVSGLDQPGLYRLALTAQAEDGREYSSELAFIVRDESREMTTPAADWQMMSNLASTNSAAGGRVLLPDEIGEALSWLKQRQDETKIKTVEKRRLGDAAWDSWLYLTLFCLLLSIEWSLRKSWQLP